LTAATEQISAAADASTKPAEVRKEVRRMEPHRIDARCRIRECAKGEQGAFHGTPRRALRRIRASSPENVGETPEQRGRSAATGVVRGGH
jgi:hypothetical protein